MILIRNREFGKYQDCEGIDLILVYNPDFDGSIHRYVDHPDWEVIVKPVAEKN